MLHTTCLAPHWQQQNAFAANRSSCPDLVLAGGCRSGFVHDAHAGQASGRGARSLPGRAAFILYNTVEL
eukprot:1142362-Pelagomonas_calceolata.AAC.11